MRPTDEFRHEHEEVLEHVEQLVHAPCEIPRPSEEERAAAVPMVHDH